MTSKTRTMFGLLQAFPSPPFACPFRLVSESHLSFQKRLSLTGYTGYQKQKHKLSLNIGIAQKGKGDRGDQRENKHEINPRQNAKTSSVWCFVGFLVLGWR